MRGALQITITETSQDVVVDEKRHTSQKEELVQ